MGRVERAGDLLERVEDAVRLEPVRDEPPQVGAADELHREVEPVVRLAGLVHRDDVRMVERGLEHRLAAEPGGELRVGREVRREHLQRDRALERELRRLVHDAHPAAPEDALDAVAGDRLTRREHQR